MAVAGCVDFVKRFLSLARVGVSVGIRIIPLFFGLFLLNLHHNFKNHKSCSLVTRFLLCMMKTSTCYLLLASALLCIEIDGLTAHFFPKTFVAPQVNSGNPLSARR